MNIVKIIKNLKFLRVLMKKHLADENLQFEIRHDPKNVIDLDAATEDSEEEKKKKEIEKNSVKMIKANEGGISAMEAAEEDFNKLELTTTVKETKKLLDDND